MTRIVLGTNGLEYGGAQAVVVTLANEFARRAHDVTIWTLSATAGLERVDDLDEAVNVRQLAFEGFNSPAAIRRFRKVIREDRPEAAMYVCNPVAASIHSLSAPKTRVVYCVHNYVRSRYGRSLELGARLTGARIVALNESCASTVLGGCRTIVPNATEPPQRVADGTPAFAEGHLLVVGRLILQKDPAFLLEVMTVLRDRGRRFELDIVGSRGLFDEMRAVVQERDLGDLVHFRGTVESAPWFARRPLFVMTSRWEGQSIALLEAASYGCPIIARDAPGVRDTLGADYEGLTPYDDIEAMATTIDEWVSHPDATAERALRLQARMQDEFSLERIVDEWEQLLGARRNPRRGGAGA